MNKLKVCILTSVHPPSDTRVFHKEAKSLVQAGYAVTFVVPHDHDEYIDGIQIKAIEKEPKRLKRMTLTIWNVYQEAMKANAHIYHFHDPELLPIGLLLKLRRKKVIYDVHEYYKDKIKSKHYMPSIFRNLAALLFDIFESFAAMFFDAVIVTDDITAKKFNNRVTTIANYPYMPEQLEISKKDSDCFTVIYAGALTEHRGLLKMIEAMKHVTLNAKLILIGIYKLSAPLEHEKVVFLGNKPWPDTIKLISSSHVGLAVFQPVPGYSYYGMNVVKIYEYMMLGIPVIASNFPNLARIINEIKCGIVVDPTDSKAIARAIEYIITHPSEAEHMGIRGRKAVEERFNWKTEEKKLINLYQKILQPSKA